MKSRVLDLWQNPKEKKKNKKKKKKNNNNNKKKKKKKTSRTYAQSPRQHHRLLSTCPRH